MGRAAIVSANAAVALGFLVLAIMVLAKAGGSSAQGDAAMAAAAGAVHALLAFGVYARGKLLVYVVSIPLLIALCGLGVLLLFAPMAWGKSNEAAALLLQALVLLLAALQVANLVSVRGARQ
jgi:hypothetical protein